MHPEWQGLGLGGHLQQRLIEYAKSKGLRGFTADHSERKREDAGGIRRRAASRSRRKVVEGTYEVVMLFE